MGIGDHLDNYYNFQGANCNELDQSGSDVDDKKSLNLRNTLKGEQMRLPDRLDASMEKEGRQGCLPGLGPEVQESMALSQERLRDDQ